ncbi:MAG: peptidoglycan DD-metalloendopeptidase family protein [Helicobacteraceae bacterium]|jgi:murein DD-endopeptidase MepM/ murein hydrolase activator NlpD|nr:peptidoglycan DD-metalloendopeptidase family protein [Helicobacteraceae bacterium]
MLIACLAAAFSDGDTNYPGGIAIVPLGVSGVKPANVTFNGKPLRVERLPGNEWAAVVGLSIDTMPNSTQVVLRKGTGNQNVEVPFTVIYKEYPLQKVTVDDSFLNLDEATQKRVQAESVKLNKELAAFTQPAAGLDLSLPLLAPISGQFGAKRIFNAQPRRPHSGTDIAAVKGTAVKAAQNGTVALSEQFFFCGNMVLLNHGEGLFTMYCHLDKRSVNAGKKVRRGDAIGTVGDTGRVSGAHLHFAAALNGDLIDPLLLLSGEDRANLLNQQR